MTSPPSGPAGPPIGGGLARPSMRTAGSVFKCLVVPAGVRFALVGAADPLDTDLVAALSCRAGAQ